MIQPTVGDTTSRRSSTWVVPAFVAVVLSALFIWLWQFRLAALLRHLASGYVASRPPLISIENAPAWLVPIYSAINYLNSTWETTLAALLIAGTVQTFLHVPLLRLIRSRSGWRGYLAGIAFGIPNLFCTCCAAPLFAGLFRKGTSLGTSLATFITAPSLNVAVVMLAFAFLPLPLAAARVVLGLVAALAIPYLAVRFSGQPPPVTAEICDNETFEWRSVSRAWIANTWSLARVALPLLVSGYLLVSTFQVFMPLKTIAPALDNGLLSVVLVSLIGTLIMVPTFSEIALVAALVPLGIGVGPAVALLITAPAVSLPSLLVIGRTTGSLRVPLALFGLVFLLGIIGGSIATLA